MPILLPDRHTVVPVPRIQRGLLSVVGHRHCLFQGRAGGVTLSNTYIIQFLHIYRTSRVPIVLPADYHSMAPCHPCVLWNLLQYPKSHIYFNICFYFLILVSRHLGRGINSKRLHPLLQLELERRSMHEWQRLMLTCVECAAFEA